MDAAGTNRVPSSPLKDTVPKVSPDATGAKVPIVPDLDLESISPEAFEAEPDDQTVEPIVPKLIELPCCCMAGVVEFPA
jgi:hypothetical protein